LKLTAEDNLRLGIIDGIIPEPLGGAHKDIESAFANVREQIVKDIQVLLDTKIHDLIDLRIEKFSNMGVTKLIQEEEAPVPVSGE